MYNDYLPECMGRWLSGSGGHILWSADCDATPTWGDTEGYYFCDEHLPRLKDGSIHPSFKDVRPVVILETGSRMIKIVLDDELLMRIGHDIQISGVLYSSRDCHYVVPFPDEDHPGDDERPALVLDMGTEDWGRFLKQSDTLEVEVLAKAKDGTITKAILRKASRQISAAVSWEVFQRDGYRCRYCGRTGIPLTVDHLVLWENGGPSTKENMVAACKKCNKLRGNMEYEDWLDSPEYRKVSRGLEGHVFDANNQLVDVLAGIPRQLHVHSR